MKSKEVIWIPAVGFAVSLAFAGCMAWFTTRLGVLLLLPPVALAAALAAASVSMLPAVVIIGIVSVIRNRSAPG